MIDIVKNSSILCIDARGTATGSKLWKKIKQKAIGLCCSDYWKSHREFIPSSIYIRSKAETYTVEGYNSIIRHFLARMKRKTKCYSKATHMLEKSLLLLMLKRNNQLSILI